MPQSPNMGMSDVILLLEPVQTASKRVQAHATVHQDNYGIVITGNSFQPTGECTMSQNELNELVRRCQEENEKYRSAGTSDPAYCLKLFRLALEENRDDAWEHIVICYTPNVQGWFYNNPLNQLLLEDLEDITIQTFELFVEGNRKKPLQITSLGGILTYLHRCLNTAVMLRKRYKDKEPSNKVRIDQVTDIPGQNPISQLLDILAAEEIWKMVTDCCDNDIEKQVMRLLWVLHYTAPEIVQYLAVDGLAESRVRQIERNVTRRLRKRYPHLRPRNQ